MRILVVNWQDRENPQAGGAEIHLHEVFGRLGQRHQVDLLVGGWPGAAKETVLDGMAVTRVGRRLSFPLHAHRAYRRLERKNRYDVVVEDINKIPLWVPRWKGARTVALVHHLFGATAFQEATLPIAAATWCAEKPLGWSVYQKTPFQAVSESTSDDLVRRGVPRESIRVIYNGVDTQWLTPSFSARAAFPLFAYVGRLKRYKRVEILIRAFGRLVAGPGPWTGVMPAGLMGQARLAIAGRGDDRGRLEALVRELGLAGKVDFLGFISPEEKRGLMRRAWATMLASPKEGWGISNMETSACGTPVIAADAPGVRESVLDGRTGFLVSGTPEGFAEGMNRLIESPGLLKVLGAAGRVYAETLSWERAAGETERHLEEVVGRESPD